MLSHTLRLLLSATNIDRNSRTPCCRLIHSSSRWWLKMRRRQPRIGWSKRRGWQQRRQQQQLLLHRLWEACSS